MNSKNLSDIKLELKYRPRLKCFICFMFDRVYDRSIHSIVVPNIESHQSMTHIMTHFTVKGQVKDQNQFDFETLCNNWFLMV